MTTLAAYVIRLYLGVALLASILIALPFVAAYMVTIAPLVVWNDHRQRRASKSRRRARIQAFCETEGR